MVARAASLGQGTIPECLVWPLADIRFPNPTDRNQPLTGIHLVNAAGSS
jgi:hypothetical protein